MEDEILLEFVAESWENLARLDAEIVELEQRPDDRVLLDGIFRTLHTIKGTCGFIGLARMAAVAHSAENVLGQLRTGSVSVTPELISLVLESVDRIRELLRGVEATSEEPEIDSTELIARLDEAAGITAAVSIPTAELDALFAARRAAVNEASQPAPAATVPEATAPEATVSDATEPATTATPPASTDSSDSPQLPAAVDPARSTTCHGTAQPQLVEPVVPASPATESGQPGTPADSTDTVKATTVGDPETGRPQVADLSVRVSVDVLDRLMNLVGELVLTRNQLLQLVRSEEESRYASPVGLLNRVTTDLQEGVMQTRMQPIGNAWAKLPRMVRDLAWTTGRQLQLEMTGAETELDRTVLDAIRDPLTHMVRNSADHGIEPPEERQQLGKPSAGTIQLDARHEGGHVVISINDDGRGIDLESIRSRAIEKGLVTAARAGSMARGELLSLIFEPGFSTAREISSVSGRGVGLDVVRTQIERIGGTIDVNSIKGQGTAFRIRIPLTLAIISALVVESGGQCFAIPQLAVVELVRLPAEARQGIERIHDQEFFRLRDRLLPLVPLSRVLGLDACEEDAETRDTSIVVVQAGEFLFGLTVCEVFDTEEIVVKPVGVLLKHIPVWQGTTILGDGRVIMILDVTGVAAALGTDVQVASQRVESESRQGTPPEDERRIRLLKFRSGGLSMAVPLSLVARLEEFEHSSLERNGEGLVVQYRGSLLPLQRVAGVNSPETSSGSRRVIVFADGSHAMGLLVDEIQDIVDEPLVIRQQAARPGVCGTAIVGGAATEIIDTGYYISQIGSNWFEHSTSQPQAPVLIVDDSLFFRQLATTALETAGWRVVAAAGAAEAMELLSAGREFAAVLCDLDLSPVSGFELATWIRDRAETTTLPVIALTALNRATFESRALAAGCSCFLSKFSAREVLATLDELACGATLEPQEATA